MVDQDFPEPGYDLAAWLQLLRVSAVPSAITNILAGYLIANRSWQPTFELLLLIVCSCLFYMSGMVLNDWCDSEKDRHTRPDRPIPSGRISRRASFQCYLSLTASGLLLSAFVGPRSLLVSLALVIAIIFYNAILKSTMLGPPTMGACRFLNILLGGSSATQVSAEGLSGWPMLAWWVAFSLALLITGLTWFARKESETSRRTHLVASAVTMAIGIGCYAMAPWWAQVGPVAADSTGVRYVIMIALISLPILRHVVTAIVKPEPAFVQGAVQSVLRSLIFLDAAVCYLVSDHQLFYPVMTVLFVLPSLLLSRLTAST